jgi:hypothetical protein
MACPLCNKRPAKRWCPAKGERICAVCCGTEREVTMDCPSDCEFLVAARRYEAEHRKPLPPDEVPYPDVEFPPEVIHELRPVLSGLGFQILKAARENPAMVDADALAALSALAEAYRTRAAGLYYERPPEAGCAREVYSRLAEFIAEVKKQQTERTGFATLKDSEVFHLLVFLLRVAKHNTNGRPRSRAFLDFLRAQYPKEAGLEREPPRIITP